MVLVIVVTRVPASFLYREILSVPSCLRSVVAEFRQMRIRLDDGRMRKLSSRRNRGRKNGDHSSRNTQIAFLGLDAPEFKSVGILS